MGIDLVKGQRISLEKESGGGLTKVVMGLGWDPVTSSGGGFFKKLASLLSKPKEIDLDASCALFDSNKTPVDFVWFAQLRSKDGSIVHTGDNLTGAGDAGDDEQIIVDLSKIPSNVTTLVFTVNSFQGQTFNEVNNAFCRIVDSSNNKEIARYTLSGGGTHTAMIMAKIYRHEGEWKMTALGEAARGQVVAELLPAIATVL
ncbi:MAG: TerD family protein [Deltaproteobacteria bacterium]|jgi:tellurium resistance protein TerZ|nr:TerD family protein [Deltaproteobacteria bacterium]